MSQPIIIADTSTTIQKVINISLSEGPFSVETCQNYSELTELIQDGVSYIILLDVNFTTSFEGSELITKLLSINENLKFVVMFTTRDQPLAETMTGPPNTVGLKKPFETSDLISVCNQMIVSSESSDGNEADFDTEFGDVSFDEGTDWQISVPGVIGFSDEEKLEVPDIITSNENVPTSDFDADRTDPFISSPPGQSFSIDDFKESKPSVESDDNQFPTDSDLEFPDPIDEETKPKFESLENLNLDDEEISQSSGSLQLEVEEEEEEHGNWESNDPQTFWTPDNNEEEQDLKQLDDETKGGEFFAFPSQEPEDQAKEIVDRLMPMIEQMIKEYCSQAVDKIAWEVIPDLAENLIKTELKTLKEETLKQP
jgi:hypothetical protein